MPLTAQEERCVRISLPLLATAFGGKWHLPSNETLADLNTSESTPECIVTNGALTAAVEVKRLMGDSEWVNHKAILRSLMRSLVPACGGQYLVLPPQDFYLSHMDSALARRVRREITRVARDLSPGDIGGIRVRRNGWIVQQRSDGPGRITCYHTDGDAVAVLSDQIVGMYQLVDSDGRDERMRWAHSFVSEQCRTEFHEAVLKAVARRASGLDNHLSWDEEWELHCLDKDPTEESYVEVFAPTHARSVPQAATENLDTVLTAALRKFTKRPWADKHVVILENQFFEITSADNVREMLTDASEEALASLDLIVVADDEVDSAEVVWQKGRS